MASPEKRETSAATAKKSSTVPSPSVSDTMKSLLADPKDRIKLDDYVTELLKTALGALATDPFWQSVPGLSAESFQARLDYYDATIRDLLLAVILLVRWGQTEQTMLLERIFSRLAEANQDRGGILVWLSARWYPVSLLSYAAGITALTFGNYPALRAILLTMTNLQRGDDKSGPLSVAVGYQMGQINDTFKLIPAHSKNRVPVSEFMFAKLGAQLEELLFLGSSYERYFDEYEILAALTFADYREAEGQRVWAMPGRFGWKFVHTGKPYDTFVKDAVTAGANWPVLRADLFGASANRFEEIAKSYRVFLTELNWY